MRFNLDHAFNILQRTPHLLRDLLTDLPEGLSTGNEGNDTWSPYDVIGHLIHGERTDWIPRTKIILEKGDTIAFPKFDRFAQFEESKGKSLEDLLSTFEILREENLRTLKEMNLTARDLSRKGKHPELGPVTLEQLLATWVAHDLDHLVQIGRTMARQYSEEVGPWKAYISALRTDSTRKS